jgi:hypothetical protein
VDIVRRALEEPVRQIAENAGYDGGVIVAEVERKGENIGFNAQSGEYENLLDLVPDPTKVTRSALQNAASIAAMLLTTETLISDIPKRMPQPLPDAGLLDRQRYSSKRPGVIRASFAFFKRFMATRAMVNTYRPGPRRGSCPKEPCVGCSPSHIGRCSISWTRPTTPSVLSREETSSPCKLAA